MIQLGEIAAGIIGRLARPIDGEIRRLEIIHLEQVKAGKRTDALATAIRIEELRERRLRGAKWCGR